MDPRVRDLFKRFILVGRDYPIPPPFVRNKVAEAFRKTKITNDKELRQHIGRGRWMVKELMGVIQLKKYRTLKRRYDVPNEPDPVDIANSIAKDKFGV